VSKSATDELDMLVKKRLNILKKLPPIMGASPMSALIQE
jgi:hypothetical protein